MAVIAERQRTTGPLVLGSLSIRRTGEFLQLVEPGSNHCGPENALEPLDYRVPHGRGQRLVHGRAIRIRYELLATCGPTLDTRGFLFDQVEVQTWLETEGRRAPTSLSCELLVITMANRFQDDLAIHNPHCELRGLSLTFSPAPHLAGVQVHLGRPPRFNV